MRKMKDSGIDWIGEIPESWSCKKIKHSFSLVAGATPKSGTADYWDGNIVWITPADYTTEKVYVSEGHKKITLEGLESCATTIIPEGSIIFSKRAPVGLVAINKVPLCTNQGCISCIPNKNVDTKFYYYVMSVFSDQFDLHASGTTFKEISSDAFANFLLPYTEYEEQNQIAAYLDRKCAEIDALITSKEKTNELLKERRQSIIYEAVTKGLNPDAPMKDSGIEWIGMIPAHWSVWRLKHLLAKTKGAIKAGPFGSSLNATDMQGHDIKVFTQRTVLDNDFVAGDEYISREKYEELKGFTAQANDILVTTRGTIGKAAIVPSDTIGILHPCLIKIYIEESIMNRHLLCRIFNETSIFLEQLRLASNATTIDVIYTQNLMNIFVPLAPSEEQEQICNYVDDKCAELDALISANEETIQKLKEYRQSIIYEAVTGKIEV